MLKYIAMSNGYNQKQNKQSVKVSIYKDKYNDTKTHY